MKLWKTITGSIRKNFSGGGTPSAFPVEYQTRGSGIKTAYEKSAVAYSCIRRISQDISGVPLLFLRDKNDPDSAVAENHPTKMLIKNPAPNITTEQMFQYMLLWLETRGEFFLLFDNPDKPTTIIPTVDPLMFRTLAGPKQQLKGFKLQFGQWTDSFLPGDVIHHRFISTTNPFRGMSPLQSAAHALNIQISGDKLASDIIDRGGETGLIYETDDELLEEQQEELLTKLRGRRDAKGQIPKDLLLSGGLKITDPKFTAFDYKIFEQMPESKQKITMVYGMSPSLIGEDDEPNYSTFEGRLKIYWHQTLMPTVRGIESALDQRFAVGPDPVFIRLDRSQIQGIQADKKQLAETSEIMHRSGLPWTVIDAVLNLNLPLDDIPAADQVMVPANLAPLEQLVSDWEYLPPATAVNLSAVPTKSTGKLTNVELRKRATDQAVITQRNRLLGATERNVSRSWRTLNFKYRKQVLAAWDKAAKDEDHLPSMVSKFETAIEPILVDKMADDAVSDIQPQQIKAGEIGESSIETLTNERAMFGWMNTKVGQLSPKTLEEIMKRENLIVNLTDEGLFQLIMKAIKQLLLDTGEVHEIEEVAQFVLDAQNRIKHEFNNSANRAQTIARTEVGTAFNVGRFNEMKNQGWTRHEWFANDGDPDTRETHQETHGQVVDVGSIFEPVGLAYPQDPSGPPEEVINCRCLTIPVITEED